MRERTDATRDGLIWDHTGLDLEPRWPREPSIHAIRAVCRRVLGIRTPLPSPELVDGFGHPIAPVVADPAVHLHTTGAYNKLYLIESPSKGGQRYMMRVSLPVDPGNKTRGEVATLRLVRKRVSGHNIIPVPAVVDYDDTTKNEIGFEWVLMQLLPGRPAYYRWRNMTMPQKEDLVRRVAEFQAKLARVGPGPGPPPGGTIGGNGGSGGGGFRTIGTLGAHSDNPELLGDSGDGVGGAGLAIPGRIVHPVFFTGPHYHYAVPRGPFRSSHDWLRSFLNIIIKEHTAALASFKLSRRSKDNSTATNGNAMHHMHHDDTEMDREYAESTLRVARKLLRLLPKLFPSVINPPERTMLWHDDLSLNNILVSDDATGANQQVTGIIGWECASTMPTWVGTQFPEFLRGADRYEKPVRERYTDVSPTASDDFTSSGSIDDDGGPDNEGKTELYWIHLMEFEQTHLRKVYSARMRELTLSSTSGARMAAQGQMHPWDEAVLEAQLRVDFLGAVSRCGAGFYLRRIEQWVDAVERKEFLGLMEVLRVGIPRKEKDRDRDKEKREMMGKGGGGGGEKERERAREQHVKDFMMETERAGETRVVVPVVHHHHASTSPANVTNGIVGPWRGHSNTTSGNASTTNGSVISNSPSTNIGFLNGGGNSHAGSEGNFTLRNPSSLTIHSPSSSSVGFINGSNAGNFAALRAWANSSANGGGGGSMNGNVSAGNRQVVHVQRQGHGQQGQGHDRNQNNNGNSGNGGSVGPMMRLNASSTAVVVRKG